MVPPMSLARVSDVLSLETVVLFAPGTAKKKAMEKLVNLICRVGRWPSPESMLAKVLERENGISTTLDTGLSLPHARLSGISGITAGLAVTSGDFLEAPPSRAIFLFFSPDQREFYPVHLKFLRAVSAFFTPELIAEMGAAGRAQDVLEMIRRREMPCP